jgi:hypothetical protein
MSMKNSNDTIGNRTRDLPVCSAVPEQIAPLRAHTIFHNNTKLIIGKQLLLFTLEKVKSVVFIRA